MKSRRSVDTELLYRGNHIPGIAELPDTPPIYHATAYAVKDTDDYDRANRGEKYFYNRTANPNRDCLGEIISYLEYGENTIICIRYGGNFHDLDRAAESRRPYHSQSLDLWRDY